MTAQDLKNSILQLAMQGKLVEQRAEEGTARELIEQIGIEKERLIKEEKIKKEKPLPKTKEGEIPFEIPGSWEWVRLGNCISLLSGQDMTPDKYNDGGMGIPYLTGASNIEDGKIIINRWTDEPKAIAIEGNLLITCKGTIGVTCILTEKKVHIARQIMAITAICVDIEYINKFLQLYVGVLKNKAKSMIPGIERKDILNAMVPLPPLAEQKRIVAKIEELLLYIEKYDKAYSKLKRLDKKFSEDIQKSILQYAMQGKLVEQRAEEGTGDELYYQIQAVKKKMIQASGIKKGKSLPEVSEAEKPFDIPTSWRWVRLGEIIVFQGGYAFKSDTYIEKSDNQVVRLGNVKNNNLLLHEKEVFVSDELAKKNTAYMIRENDILVSMTGTRRKKDYFYTVLVGKNDVSQKNLYLNQRVGCFRAIEGIYHKYLLLALQNDIIKYIIFTKETGTANQGNLGSEDMKQFVYIPLPPYEEQKRIVEELEKIMPYCEKMVSSIS